MTTELILQYNSNISPLVVKFETIHLYIVTSAPIPLETIYQYCVIKIFK